MRNEQSLSLIPEQKAAAGKDFRLPEGVLPQVYHDNLVMSLENANGMPDDTLAEQHEALLMHFEARYHAYISPIELN